jgi:hypothetical protein
MAHSFIGAAPEPIVLAIIIHVVFDWKQSGGDALATLATLFQRDCSAGNKAWD